MQQNLAALRSVIKQYTKDRQQPPQSLQDLVTAGYFRELPLDPLTNTNSSWQPVTGDGGIVDVRSN